MSLPDMDREVKGQYEVIIQAKDMAGQLGGLSGMTSVNISLSDVNDNPPHFPQSEYSITGDPKNRHSYHPEVYCFPITARPQVFLYVSCHRNLASIYFKKMYHTFTQL